jgi:ring-1,2-phenylacetyl-CoA epoxidase subunit PaaD
VVNLQEKKDESAAVMKADLLDGSNFEINAIWTLLEAVKDPEIPVLSLRDLGVLRDVEIVNDKVIITITPTYSGCPAMDTIRSDIKVALNNAGYANSEIVTALSPAWTTDWMSEDGKRKLEQFGIAAPAHTKTLKPVISCPRCRSVDSILISEYGSTACKSMYKCNDCKEAFCYFKAI